MSIPVPGVPGRRPGTPTDKLTNSLSQIQTHSTSPFLHGMAMMSPTHKRKLIVTAAGHKQSNDRVFNSPSKHKKNGEKSVISSFRKRGSVKSEPSKAEMNKKVDTPATPTRYGGRMPSLTKSSSAFFPNSIDNGSKSPAVQQKTSRSTVGGIKGIWKRNSRKKTAVKTESEDWVDIGGAIDQSPVRELPRRLSLRRKNSVAGDKVSHK